MSELVGFNLDAQPEFIEPSPYALIRLHRQDSENQQKLFSEGYRRRIIDGDYIFLEPPQVEGVVSYPAVSVIKGHSPTAT